MNEARLGCDSFWLARLDRPTRLVRASFQEECGVRIGHAAVVSRKVHTVDPASPQIVMVLKNADAGRTFYQRSDIGKVCHLDVFHQCGQVDHRQTAALIRQAVDIYNCHVSRDLSALLGKTPHVSADLIDLQTGTGGGRVTGALVYGRKASLRRAHENHVHIAALLSAEQLTCLFYLVLAAEAAILTAGLELRRNEQIINTVGAQSSADLSPYSDRADSFLQPKEAGLPPALGRHRHLQDIADLTEEFDSVQDIREALSAAASGRSEQEFVRAMEGRGNGAPTVEKLERQGIIHKEDGIVRLTDYGRELAEYLERHLPDIEAFLRRSFRMSRPPARPAGSVKCTVAGAGGGGGAKSLTPWTGAALAVAETVNAAARRAVGEHRGNIDVAPSDLREYRRKKRQKAEICLVIDASASMAGQRIRAAKFLARHLLLSTSERVGVIIFQEEAARVELPFTRDICLAEASLRRIRPGGSTPLASGLETCLAYLEAAPVRDPLIILITDGIPTVADQPRNPMEEALAAAAKIRRAGYGFTCIGLKPNRSYLAQLAVTAGGSIYVLEELEKHSLVTTAWKEYADRSL